MSRLKELLAKSSGKYYDWKNKRANERPARELKSKQRALIKQQALESRINKIKTRNRLLKVQNQGISLRKNRLRSTIGFFTGTKPIRATRRNNRHNRLRNRPRRAYRYVIQRPTNPPMRMEEHTKMWFER
jgi:hypothetical protein